MTTRNDLYIQYSKGQISYEVLTAKLREVTEDENDKIECERSAA